MHLEFFTVKVKGGENRIITLVYTGNAVDFGPLANPGITAVKKAFLDYMEKTFRKPDSPNRVNLHLEKVQRNFQSVVQKRYGNIHLWVVNLQVKELK